MFTLCTIYYNHVSVVTVACLHTLLMFNLMNTERKKKQERPRSEPGLSICCSVVRTKIHVVLPQ